MSPTSAFDKGARRFLTSAIGVYQRHLSPRKGFRCAWRALHGGDSCSQAVKRLLLERSLPEALVGARLQFAGCHAASQTLRANRMRAASMQVLSMQVASGAQIIRQARFADESQPDDEDKRREENRCGPDCLLHGCDLGDCCCYGAEMSECLAPRAAACTGRLPSFHAFDCAAADAGASGCSCLDCSACACWPF